MFNEVHTLEDLKYVHFVVLIFRDADQCKKHCIDLNKQNLTPNKQYWALVTEVNEANEIHTNDAFYVVFKDDGNCMHGLWIFCNLCENGITVYTFRTPDEEMSLLNYKADKITDILERTVLKYDDHPRRSEDERFQTNLERTADEKYIRELCQEEGLYDPDNHDTLNIDWLHWRPGHQYRVHYNQNGRTSNGVSFNVDIGGQILGSSDSENICTLPLEIVRYRNELREFTETHPDEFPEDGFPIIPYTDTEIGPHAFRCPSDWIGKVTKIKWKSDDDYHGIDKATVKCFPNQYIKFLKDKSMLKHVKLIPVMAGSITGDKTKEFNIQRLIGFMLSA